MRVTFARRVALVGALGVGALLLGAPAASAGVDPIDYSETCSLSVTPSTFTAGQSVTVNGTGYQPNFTTDIIFDRGEPDEATLATDVTTDASGSFSQGVTIPATAAVGPHTISAVCDAAGTIPSTSAQVLSAQVTTTVSAAPRAVARTGTDSGPLVAVGAGAVLAGAAFVLAARRRRATIAS